MRRSRTVLLTENVVTGGGGGQSRPQRQAVSDLPVCAAKERDHFFNGAATPPRRRGNDHASSRSLHALKSATTLLAVLLLFSLTSCRQYMADQPRYNTYQESGFFPDGTSARPLPEGVIPQGFERPQASAAFPFPATMDVLKRGRERFDIFCTPCHDHIGTGQGMAVRRGFRESPPSFHIDRLRAAPDSHFVDVITNGFGVMPSYAFQIPVGDRWAIVAYVRALQLSFSARTADIPPEELRKLESEKQ
jgi:hypothetical protein